MPIVWTPIQTGATVNWINNSSAIVLWGNDAMLTVAWARDASAAWTPVNTI